MGWFLGVILVCFVGMMVVAGVMFGQAVELEKGAMKDCAERGMVLVEIADANLLKTEYTCIERIVP